MQIGFIGLGAMGAASASNLLASGHHLCVFNRSPARAGPLRDAGASVAAVGSLFLGTMLALGLERVRSRPGRAIGAVTLMPLVTPEIVTGVAALLFFTGIGMKLSLLTVTLAEITFSIAYVTVIVRGRLASMSPEVEDAARADQIFSMLMGDQVEPRRDFIVKNAKDVRFLDV